MSLLTLVQVHGGYGSVDVLQGVDLRVERGEIVVIIGPNGAGKSTVLKAVCGLARVRSGEIRFADTAITRLRPDQMVRQGLCFVPQERNVFPTLTVHENLEMGAFILRGDISARLARVYDIFPPLKEKRHQMAGTLSGGQRQMVAMGRALMLEPQLLLLDEPTAGLSPKFTQLIFDKVCEINALGVAILMVEQKARAALALAQRGYVLALGRNRHEDTGANLLADRAVAAMFLGG